MQISGDQETCSATNFMAPDKLHIPSFGDWNRNQDVFISEYFDIARASRVKKEDHGNGHAVPGPKGQLPIHQHGLKSSSMPKKRGAHKKVPTANSATFAPREQDLCHVKPGDKKEIYQRIHRSTTDMVAMNPSALVRKEYGVSRSPSPSSTKTGNEKSSANKKPSKVHIPSFGDWNGNQEVIISEYFDIARASRVEKEGSGNGYAVPGAKGRVPIHQTGLNSSSIPEKRGAHRKVPTSSRPANSAPLASREQDLYHVKPGAKKEIYQRKSKSATDVVSVVPSAKVRKEFGGSRTPNPSYVKTCYEKPSANNKATKKKALPKFGDWDVNDPTGGTPFTTIFDEARNEKKGAMPANKTSSQRNASSPIDEDLYKQQSYSHKKYGEKMLSIISKIFSGKMICQ